CVIEAIGAIKTIETSILNESSTAMSASEKEIVLRYASVARYSMAYWYQMGQGSNPWNVPPFQDDNLLDPNFYRLSEAAEADARGIIYAGTNVAAYFWTGPWGVAAIILVTGATCTAIQAQGN
ncbi:MAG: hypothetical protein M3Q97_09410, partial [Bacteroidota bacterium]|nr:hypothetical protein [Bacteroidota bacterium]